MHFETNQGQLDNQVKFVANGSGYSLFLTGTEMVFSLQKAKNNVPFKEMGGLNEELNPPATDTSIVRMKMVGSNASPQISGLDELPGKSNYFIGNDPSRWRTNVSQYGKVKYQAVYPGIDLVFYGNQKQLEYDFIVAPGANPADILLDYNGAENPEINRQGELVLHTPGGDIVQHAPQLYQEVGKLKKAVAGSYTLAATGKIGFIAAGYDSSLPLVIDPVLNYSTYLGGTIDNGSFGIAVNSSGNAFLTGYTSSTNFPTQNPLQVSNAGGFNDVFISKLSADGQTLLYSTYLGGSANDIGFGIALDSSENIYITGHTDSTNFPTSHPFQSVLGGYNDAFVAKISADGESLLYSTYLGGISVDEARSVTVDSNGQAYVTGKTASSNFPTQNPFQANYMGSFDAFVTEMSVDGQSLVYSTFLGGSNQEISNGIALDNNGNMYLGGTTTSTNFPTQNPFQAVSTGDGFVTRLSANGQSLIYSSYFRGVVYGIAVDNNGSLYVTGTTNSADFPTKNAFQPVLNGLGDGFVTKFSPDGQVLVYSTFLGGTSADEYGTSIMVDTNGNSYITGTTTSNNFPTKNPFQSVSGSTGTNDAFITKLSTDGQSLVYSSYLGGNHQDIGVSIAVDSNNNAYITGSTFSTNFPTKNPFQPNLNSTVWSGFVTKISSITLSPALLPDGQSGTNYNQTLSATNGTAPYTFALTSGALPTGITLDSNTGLLSGSPSVVGSFNFSITVTDANGNKDSQSFTLQVNSNSLSTCNLSTLTSAINNAAPGTVLTFSCSGTITLNSTLNITKNLTIDGSGQNVIISGGGSVGVFKVNSGVTLNLSHLTIANGSATNGGGINNEGGTVNGTVLTLLDNVASQHGGAVYNNGGKVTFTDSIITRGNVYSTGSTITLNHTNVSVT